MTTSQHRNRSAATDPASVASAATAPLSTRRRSPRRPDPDGGRAPFGMWWVAWRQHRALLASVGLALVVIAGGLLWFHQALQARIDALAGPAAAACSVSDNNRCPSSVVSAIFDGPWSQWWNIIRTVLMVLPVVLGALVGVAVFTREFERGTAVLALTQSVRRRRWWATKLVVVAVPVVAAMVGLGWLTQWTASVFYGFSNAPIQVQQFLSESIVPAAFTLVGIAFGATCGIVLRSTLPAVVVALLLAVGVLLGLGYQWRGDLLPAQRDTTSFQLATSGGTAASSLDIGGPATGLILDSGFLNAAGRPVSFDAAAQACQSILQPPSTLGAGEPYAPSPQSIQQYDSCVAAHGIAAQYTDYLPGSDLWPLRWIVTGIAVALSALVLALGGLGLGRRPRGRG